MWYRAFGDYGWTFWLMLACNVGVLQLLWFTPRADQPVAVVRARAGHQRRHVARALRHRGHQPDPRLLAVRRGATSPPTWVDFGLLFGSIGMFFALYFLFVRVLPSISIFEVEELRHKKRAAA